MNTKLTFMHRKLSLYTYFCKNILSSTWTKNTEVSWCKIKCITYGVWFLLNELAMSN